MGRRASLLLATAVASSSALLLGTHAQPVVKSCRASAPLMDAATLASPAVREEKYGTDLASYLVDLHDAKATFDFCGGMMFQLVLSDKLKAHLSTVAESGPKSAAQPTLFDAGARRLSMVPEYEKSAAADNVRIFHGREVRKVPDAAGGMGFVLQLSMAGEAGEGRDPEGWSTEEVSGYDGWGHDSGRVWRDGARLEGEGVQGFRSRFGPSAFTLNHRFYLHLDGQNRMWLSAEDGCEGVVAAPAKNIMQSAMQFLKG